MPIRPENKSRYPPDWAEIRRAILDRAGNCCELCGVRNHAVGYRDSNGQFVELLRSPYAWDVIDPSLFKIVLTIMHRDHTPENCDPANLKAACQLCHNRYDAPVRAAGRRLRRRQLIEKRQIRLKFNIQGARLAPEVEISAQTYPNPNSRSLK